jgi:MFS family permease
VPPPVALYVRLVTGQIEPAPAPSQPASRRPALTPMRFVVVFGVVSLLGDFVYEGGRSVVGPYLATLGASAALVGVITGAGEAVALVFRLGTGVISDRTGRHWALTIGGYALTVVSVPLLALTRAVGSASALVVSERFGKAVRTPARDTMLSQATASTGRGFGFAIHEALDQTGALAGPLLVALVVALSGSYRTAFAVLAVPAAAAIAVLLRLRAWVPRPAAYEEEPDREVPTVEGAARLPTRFWLYGAFTALSMAGFATFAILAYHLQTRHVVSEAVIPLLYALAMGMGALAALGSGRLYDRVGLSGVVVVPPLGAVVPFLSFSTHPAAVWVGAAVWGAAMGIHESTMRAAVADLVPASRRGTGYGTFTALYGLAWFGGGAAIGALYGASIGAATTFIVVLEALALAAFAVLMRFGG